MSILSALVKFIRDLRTPLPEGHDAWVYDFGEGNAAPWLLLTDEEFEQELAEMRAYDGVSLNKDSQEI